MSSPSINIRTLSVLLGKKQTKSGFLEILGETLMPIQQDLLNRAWQLNMFGINYKMSQVVRLV